MARPEAGLDQPAGVAGHRSLREALDAFEANYIRRVLADCGGNRTRAAETLGIGRKHLWTKMQQLALDGDPKS
jgi:DNA-binding NtrC family response regulator